MSLFIALAAMLSPADAVPAQPVSAPSVQAPSPDAAPAQPVVAKTVAPKSKLICREMAATGSNMPAKKVCATAAQWREAGL